MLSIDKHASPTVCVRSRRRHGTPAPHHLYKRDIHTRHNVRWLGLSLRTLLGCIGPDGVRMSLLRLP